MNILDIQNEVRHKLNIIRALDRLVQSVTFCQCIILEPNNSDLKRALDRGDVDAVKEWMSSIIHRELCELSIRQLRMMAAQLGIRYYSSLPKDELLVLIVQEKKREANSITIDAGRMSLGSNGIEAIHSKS